jgi:hypothetical protein
MMVLETDALEMRSAVAPPVEVVPVRPDATAESLTAAREVHHVFACAACPLIEMVL